MIDGFDAEAFFREEDARATTPCVRPVLIDTGAPYDVAKLFVEHRFMADETRTLHYHRGGFYRWSGTAYTGLGDDAARSALYDFLNGCETTDKKTGDHLS